MLYFISWNKLIKAFQDTSADKDQALLNRSASADHACLTVRNHPVFRL
jgi:hypothetical protein